MEYVEGELLSTRVEQGPLPIREVVEVGMQVADALDEAHGRGIIHRDIKSANLIRTERGLVKVLDFGLAKFLASNEQRQPADPAAGDDRRHGRRHDFVHGARAGARPQRRSPRRSLLARGRALRARDRPDAVSGHGGRPRSSTRFSTRRRRPPSAVNAAIPKPLRRDRAARAGEVADVPLSDRPRHAPGPARSVQRAGRGQPGQRQPRRRRPSPISRPPRSSGRWR